VFAAIAKLASIPQPKKVCQHNAACQLDQWWPELKHQRVFLVTDSVLVTLPVIEKVIAQLKLSAGHVSVFTDVEPDPSIESVEAALTVYKNSKSQTIIALGGGSVMDCAKAVGARVASPKKSVRDMAGYLKVRGTVPDLICIPTTAGTGSEATVAAVISDHSSHEKFPINDLKLVPKLAVLDPVLMTGLPPHITAATGIDALTHAVECYINLFGNRFVKQQSKSAVQLIHASLLIAFKQGDDLSARESMALASYQAGLAFTRNYVGYVHALAHQIGGIYGVPHGETNAILLPHVLRAYGEPAHKSLAELACATGLANGGMDIAEAAKIFIKWIEELNATLGISSTFSDLKTDDFGLIIKRAKAEAEPRYPVPTTLSYETLENILVRVQA
jgi:alcohol dehydrogenase class IV